MSEIKEKIIVGKCPWCNRDLKEIKTEKGKMWVHDERTEECLFVLFENTKILGSSVLLDTDKVKTLLEYETVEFELQSKKGNSYKANILLEKEPSVFKEKKYPSYKIDSFVDKYEVKENKEKEDIFPDIELEV